MTRYLFRFGYCTPSQWAANEAHGGEDESSSAFFVEADSPEAALAWGAEVAEAFVQSLFSSSGWTAGAPSWKEARFAHWLEESPEDAFPPEQLRTLPVVKAGELPDLRRL